MSRFVMNARESLVGQALEGFEAAHGDLVRVHRDPVFVTRADPARDRVALISGGGTGHVPLHTGFVWHCKLDDAVPGVDVSRSPVLRLCEMAWSSGRHVATNDM